MKNIQKIFVPKLWVAVLLLFIPIALTIYFFVSQYSNQFLVEQQVGYFDIQNQFVARLLFDNSVSDLFNRVSDFLFWGVLAAIILVISWFVSVSKTTVHNHTAAENFVNFQQSKQGWHGSFAAKLIIKGILALLVVYLLAVIFAKLTPNLVTATGNVITDASVGSMAKVVASNAYIYGALLAIVVMIKGFRHIEL